MSVTTFIFVFVLLLLVGPVIICGWYAITRGRTEYRADGTPYYTGKLFKGWSRFWNSSKSRMPETLVKGGLIQATIKIQKEFKVGIFPDFDSGQVWCEPLIGIYLKERRYYIEELTGSKINFTREDGTTFMLSRSEKKYRFPEWVRDPLSECPTCMASVYGSIIYWSVQFLSHFRLTLWAWPWHGYALIIFWIFYCTGCAYLNTILVKKL